MMKKRHIALFLLFALCCIQLSSKEKVNKQEHIFSLHTGYANMLGGATRLTNSSRSYERKISQGISWNAQYYFRPVSIMGIGFLYSGFSSKGSHEEGKDHIYTHYMAPQVGLYCFRSQRFFIRIDVGAGMMVYRNRSEVFGKSRYVKGSDIAANAGINGRLRLTRHWNIEADIQYIASSIYKMYSHYHGEVITVKLKENPLSISRLNLSAGISYSF